MKIKIFTLFLLLYSGMSFAQDTPAASTIMNKAMEQARAENKKVFLMFHASWCSWCKRMEKNMEADATKDLFNKNYVVAILRYRNGQIRSHWRIPVQMPLYRNMVAISRDYRIG